MTAPPTIHGPQVAVNSPALGAGVTLSAVTMKRISMKAAQAQASRVAASAIMRKRGEPMRSRAMACLGAGLGSGAISVPNSPSPIRPAPMTKVVDQPSLSANTRAPAPPIRAAVRKPN